MGRTSEINRRYYLKWKYGITQVDYDALVEKQHGLCAICGRGPNGRWRHLVVDHDHETGAIRGLLCDTCNVNYGWLERFKKKIEEYGNRYRHHK